MLLFTPILNEGIFGNEIESVALISTLSASFNGDEKGTRGLRPQGFNEALGVVLVAFTVGVALFESCLRSFCDNFRIGVDNVGLFAWANEEGIF